MSKLREAGLTQYYLGIESGHDAVLARLKKGVDAAEMIRVAGKATEVGVKLSTMILLGAGGRALSLEHARASARVVNAIQPRFVSTLVMTPVEGTPLFEEAERGEVDELTPEETARELRQCAGLELKGSVFRSIMRATSSRSAATCRRTRRRSSPLSTRRSRTRTTLPTVRNG